MSAYKAHCLTLVIVDKDNEDFVEKSFAGTYFCRKVHYVPMTKEKQIQYFLSVMDQYKIDADRDAVGNLLRDLLKERSCSQKDHQIIRRRRRKRMPMKQNGSFHFCTRRKPAAISALRKAVSAS